MGKMYLGEQEIMPIETVGGGEVVNPNSVINSNHRVCQRATAGIDPYQRGAEVEATWFNGWLSDRVKTLTTDDGVKSIGVKLVPDPRIPDTGFMLKNGKNQIEHFLDTSIVGTGVTKVTLSFEALFAEFQSMIPESHILYAQIKNNEQVKSVQTSTIDGKRYVMTFEISNYFETNSIIFTTEVGLQDKYMKLTNIKLEYGEVATRYEEPDYLTELARCRQYYYVKAIPTVSVQVVGIFGKDNTARVNLDFMVPPPMIKDDGSIKRYLKSGRLSTSVFFGSDKKYTIGSESIMDRFVSFYAYKDGVASSEYSMITDNMFLTSTPLYTSADGNQCSVFDLTYNTIPSSTQFQQGDIVFIGISSYNARVLYVIFDAQED